jgi:hypothetical protein
VAVFGCEPETTVPPQSVHVPGALLLSGASCTDKVKPVKPDEEYVMVQLTQEVPVLSGKVTVFGPVK